MFSYVKSPLFHLLPTLILRLQLGSFFVCVSTKCIVPQVQTGPCMYWKHFTTMFDFQRDANIIAFIHALIVLTSSHLTFHLASSTKCVRVPSQKDYLLKKIFGFKVNLLMQLWCGLKSAFHSTQTKVEPVVKMNGPRLLTVRADGKKRCVIWAQACYSVLC